MPTITSDTVTRAMRTSTWQLSNDVLYDFCAKYPKHKRADVVAGKILLVGRVYAAAIERGVLNEEQTDFYLDEVAPKVIQSGIDTWIARVSKVDRRHKNWFDTVVEVHGETTSLFSSITGKDNRSLASKYLHFHVPSSFYIYDSRAVEAFRESNIRGIDQDVPRASRTINLGDNEYRKFVEKCEFLRRYCKTTFDKDLSPRQLDNLLLEIGE
jgi:hypothetical protein